MPIRSLPEFIVQTDLTQSWLEVVHKFGINTDIDNNSMPEDVWGGSGVYAGFPVDTLETVEVLSDSANDTAAGTGARTVIIYGLDTNYNLINETVTLNGITPVATTQQFRRVHCMQTVTAGSTGWNEGVLTARHSTTEANVFLAMVIGKNRCENTAYTIPAGYTGFITHLHGFIRKGTTDIGVEGQLWARELGGVFRAVRPFAMSSNAPLDDVILGGIVLPEKTDVICRIIAASSTNIELHVTYDLCLVLNV